MKVKCTITIDDTEYSTTVSGPPADAEVVVADAIAGCVAAAASVDDNLIASFVIANLCSKTDEVILHNAGWAHLKLNLMNDGSAEHLLLVSRDVVPDLSNLSHDILAVPDIAAARATLKE